jgi:hypothetical protein
MLEDNSNNSSQTAKTSVATSTTTTTTTTNQTTIVDFSSSIYSNSDYGNTSQKSFVVYKGKDRDKSK